MTELLKDAYSPQYITALATRIKQDYPALNSKKFITDVMDIEWPNRELKNRMYHISRCLKHHIQFSYPDSIAVLSKMVSEFGSYEAMFFPAYIELYGLDDWQTSIPALELFTQFSSSEFAVRPFIIQNQRKMMAQMKRWSTHKNYHVRRLASEGCRPRLPWAISLPEFKKKPDLILPILESLKQDPELYVRRSVANNLNDISKDHPKIIHTISKQWKGKNAEVDWLVKHACRTLLKKGDKKILQLFGYKNPKHVHIKKFTCDKNVCIGNSFNFNVEITTTSKKLGQLRIEYAIHYLKSNGKLSQKVFKISESTIQEVTKLINKNHSF
ncbi:MAG: DNA alkylation repair protein, partial [Thiohalomonadales bacterium]